ncbi:MAG: nucleotidyltransferase domain-containing protein [Microcella pacifica]|uniref:Nucleotidyltransferase n=1 Tax=Microcella pacifica TaxID=2591847 RepID=A0A9E5JM27_9MICO|nr:nucleotidyltransferase domain-containing protein [Microcella pacifica]NHF63100.1 nucleotidyltransferase [Microcella pacifica]
MSTTAPTRATLALRERLATRRNEFERILAKYGATQPRLFGSVARGDAVSESDIDIVVDMDPEVGSILMRASGLMAETRALFGSNDIDIFPVQLLKPSIAESALAEAVPL